VAVSFFSTPRKADRSISPDIKCLDRGLSRGSSPYSRPPARTVVVVVVVVVELAESVPLLPTPRKDEMSSCPDMRAWLRGVSSAMLNRVSLS